MHKLKYLYTQELFRVRFLWHTGHWQILLNILWLSHTIWRHRSMSALAQLMASKPLPEAMLTYHYWCPVGFILQNHRLPIKLRRTKNVSWWPHQMENFPRYWPFVVNSPHKGQWRGALMFSLICDWINGWINNREAGDLRCHRAHYDVIVMMNHTWGEWGWGMGDGGSVRPPS